MIRIVFKNLDESELAKQAVHARIQTTLDRFPELHDHRLTFTLSIGNSKTQLGPDLFRVKLVISGKKFDGVVFEDAAVSLYTALSDVSSHAFRRLSQLCDQRRNIDIARSGENNVFNTNPAAGSIL